MNLIYDEFNKYTSDTARLFRKHYPVGELLTTQFLQNLSKL